MKIQIEGSVSKGWMAKELGVRFDHDYYFDPQHRHRIDRACNEHLQNLQNDLGLFFTESNLGRKEFYDSNQVIVGGIQPNMIVGMLLGAELIPTDDADADISEKCLQGIEPDQLPDPQTLLSHELITLFDKQIESYLDNSQENLCPIPPFFWDRSGRAAVHGVMTSGLKFLGDEFFINMMVEPERCHHLLTWICEISSLLVAHYSELARLPITGVHIGECASCMVDVDHFRKFVVPYASMLGEQLGPVRFHSCGQSSHLLEACKEISNLQSLDVGGETSVGQIREIFGHDFPISIAPLVEEMTSDDSSDLLQWFHRIAEENNAGNLTIAYHLESHYNLENIKALHRAVETF